MPSGVRHTHDGHACDSVPLSVPINQKSSNSAMGKHIPATVTSAQEGTELLAVAATAVEAFLGQTLLHVAAFVAGEGVFCRSFGGKGQRGRG